MKLSFKSFIFFMLLSPHFPSFALEQRSMQLFDAKRERIVPVEVYQEQKRVNLPIAIINHGYGAKNTEYSFIANTLASLGYFVVSIQHDLEGDEPLPRTGNLFERRRPFWERGVQNLLFVIEELKRIEPLLNGEKVILIGHSNGGDIAMMFADLYPHKVAKIISLDSLRYPFPIDKKSAILRFGASDTQPDRGVVPASGVDVIFVRDAKHIDLCDRGSASIQQEMQKAIVHFLEKTKRGCAH